MKNTFETLRDRTEGGLRRACEKIAPGRRTAVVIGLLTAFAALNLWITGKAVRSIGREDARQVRASIPPIEIPDLVPQETVNPFEQPLNTEKHDTTDIEQR
jgi:hypothetical protein